MASRLQSDPGMRSLTWTFGGRSLRIIAGALVALGPLAAGCGGEEEGLSQLCGCSDEPAAGGGGEGTTTSAGAGGDTSTAPPEELGGAGGTGGDASACEPAPQAHRVMPLGDSITNGDGVGLSERGGWRIRYWELAEAAAPTLDFVGSLENGPSSLPDHDHEGHSGKRIEELDALVRQNGWVESFAPDVVLLMAGANDVIQDYQVTGAPARMRALIEAIHEQRPEAWILVATLTVINTVPGEARAQAFNAELPAVVAELVADCVPVRLVDMHPVLTVADIDSGGVHPTQAGYDKLAAAWFDASRGLLGL